MKSYRDSLNNSIRKTTVVKQLRRYRQGFIDKLTKENEEYEYISTEDALDKIIADLEENKILDPISLLQSCRRLLEVARRCRGKHNVPINEFIDRGFPAIYQKLLALRYSDLEMEIKCSLLEGLCTLSAADFDSFLPFVTAGVIGCIPELLDTNHREIIANCLWIIANIISSPIVKEEIMSSNLMQKINSLISNEAILNEEIATIISWIYSNSLIQSKNLDIEIKKRRLTIVLKMYISFSSFQTNESECFKETIWALRNFCENKGAEDTRTSIQLIMKWSGIQDIVYMALLSNDAAILAPAIHIIGQVAAGSEDILEGLIGEQRFENAITRILAIQNPILQKYYYWMLSNIADSNSSVSAIAKSDIIWKSTIEELPKASTMLKIEMLHYIKVAIYSLHVNELDRLTDQYQGVSNPTNHSSLMLSSLAWIDIYQIRQLSRLTSSKHS